MGAYLCGVDGGGSGCRAAIALPDGTVIGQAEGGPANYATDPAQAVGNVTGALIQAAGDADAALDDCVAWVGLAGVMDDTDADALVAKLPLKYCSASDDRPTMLAGALGDRDGALLAIGTGSFVAAQKRGNTRFIGGWGSKVGDQASGAWLGRTLLEHCLIVHDGLGDETELTRQTMAGFEGKPGKIVDFAADATASAFAKLAPSVSEAASSADTAGRMLMQRGADYLNDCLALVAVEDGGCICLSGGLGPHYEPYLADRYRALVQDAKGTALDGALTLARRKLDVRQA